LLSGVLTAASTRAGQRKKRRAEFSIANRKGRSVNATFVDDATKRIDRTRCSFVFAAPDDYCVIGSHERQLSRGTGDSSHLLIRIKKSLSRSLFAWRAHNISSCRTDGQLPDINLAY